VRLPAGSAFILICDNWLTSMGGRAMERASVNGVELEYELKGSGEPVLLIHGSHIGRSFLPLLAQPSLLEHYTLIRYHRRGFLESAPARGPVSIKDQAADARALLEHLHLSRAHIVGHSFGGAIALQLALDAPTYVHSLVLLEAPLTTVPRWKAVRELNVATAERYRQGDWEAAADPFLGSPAERAALARSVPGGLEQALRDLDTYFSVEAPAHEAWHFTDEEGKHITQPVLFMLGGESQEFYVQCHDQIQQWMLQTETVVLHGATHLLHMQQPAGAAALLLEFFARHPLVPRAQPHRDWRWRSEDMLKVGGMWVSPHEVEEVLSEDESVVECAVVGVPDRDTLIKPEAFVVLANAGGGQELEDRLRQRVRQRLGGNKTPRAFHFVESLPRTATGKVQRFKLRELAQQN